MHWHKVINTREKIMRHENSPSPPLTPLPPNNVYNVRPLQEKWIYDKSKEKKKSLMQPIYKERRGDFEKNQLII